VLAELTNDEPRMGKQRDLGEALRRFGLSLPGVFEAHPWGELVLKAKGKVFVFLGKPGDALRFSVKLPKTGEGLLDQEWAEPTGYGLGKSGWITLTVDGGNPLSESELCALLEESYRAVAPKTLVQELDGRASPPVPEKAKTETKATARPARKA
jgi:predicted DNA-binding protein (MmcQ/YjbR family)